MFDILAIFKFGNPKKKKPKTPEVIDPEHPPAEWKPDMVWVLKFVAWVAVILLFLALPVLFANSLSK